MEKIKLISDVIATWVAIFGAFAGGIIALIQYTDQLSSARVQETLKYVERFNKEPIQNATARLEQFWNKRAEKVLNPAGGEQALSSYINSEISKNNLEKDIAPLLSFFDSLQTCTCSKLCDAGITLQFFGKQAYDIHGMYHPYIVSQRDNLRDDSVGSGVESLARSYKNKNLNTYCVDNPGLLSKKTSLIFDDSHMVKLTVLCPSRSRAFKLIILSNIDNAELNPPLSA
jgi:hypothetical protein